LTASNVVGILGRMRQEEVWDAEAAQSYDTPGIGMFAPEVLGPTVERLAELAENGRVLEFAIGTGRVAVPLARKGLLTGRSFLSCSGCCVGDFGLVEERDHAVRLFLEAV
jgi:hypothetical protein